LGSERYTDLSHRQRYLEEWEWRFESTSARPWCIGSSWSILLTAAPRWIAGFMVPVPKNVEGHGPLVVDTFTRGARSRVERSRGRAGELQPLQRVPRLGGHPEDHRWKHVRVRKASRALWTRSCSRPRWLSSLRTDRMKVVASAGFLVAKATQDQELAGRAKVLFPRAGAGAVAFLTGKTGSPLTAAIIAGSLPADDLITAERVAWAFISLPKAYPSVSTWVSPANATASTALPG
jgi:hypothetical protein